MILAGTEVRLTGFQFPFFQSLGTSPNCPEFRYDGQWLSNINQLPQISVMWIFRSNILVAVQLPQVVLNVLFACSGRDFTSPHMNLEDQGLERSGRPDCQASED